MKFSECSTFLMKMKIPGNDVSTSGNTKLDKESAKHTQTELVKTFE